MFPGRITKPSPKWQCSTFMTKQTTNVFLNKSWRPLNYKEMHNCKVLSRGKKGPELHLQVCIIHTCKCALHMCRFQWEWGYISYLVHDGENFSTPQKWQHIQPLHPPPSTQEAEVGRSSSSRPAWSTEWVQRQLGLYRDTQSRKIR